MTRRTAVRRAIDRGDVDGLRAALRADAGAADALVRWGAAGCGWSPPIHYVCDLVFAGRLDGPTSRALTEVLLEHGADVDRTDRPGSLLVNAASLGAEEVGVSLLRAGATVDVTSGLHGATALHWSALLGLPVLTAALVDAGADVARRDATYDAEPLGWAVQGAVEGAPGGRGAYPAVARCLVAAGAPDPAAHCARLGGAEHAALRAVLCPTAA